MLWIQILYIELDPDPEFLPFLIRILIQGYVIHFEENTNIFFLQKNNTKIFYLNYKKIMELEEMVNFCLQSFTFCL